MAHDHTDESCWGPWQQKLAGEDEMSQVAVEQFRVCVVCGATQIKPL